MKSRTLADTVANRLARRGGPFDGLDKQIRNIASKSEVHRLDDGSIEIRVTSPNARLAQAVANQFADATNRIAAELTNTAVLQRQEFLEVQLAPALARLERSERDMVRFAKGRNVPDIEGQAEQTVKAAAELQQQVLGAEVQLAQLRRTATADNPEFRAAVNRLETLRRQLHETTSGRVGAGDLFLSLQESPELRIESTRLLREYTKNEQIYLSLVGALAQAQLDARSEVALVGVLDRAVLPSEPMSTSPLLLALAGLLLGTVVGVSGVVGQEALRAARHKPLLTSLFLAWDEFKADVASSLSGLRQARKPEAKHEAACVEESEPAPGTSSTGACT
jgi:capsule polysaccharide export protein KpsE/RkpR